MGQGSLRLVGVASRRAAIAARGVSVDKRSQGARPGLKRLALLRVVGVASVGTQIRGV